MTAKLLFMAVSNPRFEDSYARLFGSGVTLDENADEFFEKFYRRFLSSERVSGLFAHTDMDRQIAMMKHSLFYIVSYYVTNAPSAELDRLATLHRQLELEVDMFDEWLDALIHTVAESDSEADEATLLAWCWAMMPGITYMRLGVEGEWV